ncbi:MAG: 4-hydroxy-3-methylbut-2-enyl diphosphate reductase [Chloroflexi bacterium]|nr:4-hydroxy-3-methylbut-2-enyl diphosphate reductase [Chloroflexota bacterium]
MEIYRASAMGFCFGVRRALEMMEEAAHKEGPIQSLGATVHNRQVMERLARSGVETVECLEEVRGPRVAISSHGVGPDVIEKLQGQGLQILDTTCAFVRRAQRAAQRLAQAGFTVVVFGDPQHPEVKGVLGWSGGGLAIPRWEPGLRVGHRVGVLAQTTQSSPHFAQFVSQLLCDVGDELSELRVVNTICNATTQRQRAALELAQRVDIMVVVGGRNSANTQRLTEMVTEDGVETYHIETAEELNPDWFKDKHRVGITAGASTPDSVIEEVEQRLKALVREMTPSLSH